MKNRYLAALLFFLCIAAAQTALAQSGGIRLYQRPFNIGGRIDGAILIVGYTKDEADIQKLIDVVLGKANETFAKLDPMNPSSEISQINANAGATPVKVSDEVFSFFETAVKVSQWTNGFFDIVLSGEGDWRSIKLNDGASTVFLKNKVMQVRSDPMIEGFLAELMIKYVYAAGMQNAMVKVGTMFRGVGQSLSAPWKIQVEDDMGTFAHRALNLVVGNTGIATLSASRYRAQPLIDPRTKTQIRPPSRGVVVIMNDSAAAEAVAYAALVAGPQKGVDIIKNTNSAKGLVVDSSGNFLRTPGF